MDDFTLSRSLFLEGNGLDDPARHPRPRVASLEALFVSPRAQIIGAGVNHDRPTQDPVVFALLQGDEFVKDENLGRESRMEGKDVAQVSDVTVQTEGVAVRFLEQETFKISSS